MEASWDVALDFADVGRARRAFAAWLRDHVHASNPLVEYEIVFGELVTNAVRYGSRPVRVDVAFGGTQLVIRVEDWGGCFDASSARRGRTDDGGRGLDIVKMLATTFTVTGGVAPPPCRVVAKMAVLA